MKRGFADALEPDPADLARGAMPPAERTKTDFELSLETPQAAQTWGGAPQAPQDPYSQPVADEMRKPAAPTLGPILSTWQAGDRGMSDKEIADFRAQNGLPGGPGSLAALADKAVEGRLGAVGGTPEEIAYQTHIADLQKRGNEPVRPIGRPVAGFQQQSVGDWRAALAQRDPKLYNKAFGQPSAPSASKKPPSSKANAALVEFLKRLAGSGGIGG